ncbi:MAG: hypothetical protein JXX29_07305 [Deltaproteobacteria bacterium]|nr:hypothetical protein [Deltaproteobacteria bacterium]MBN2671462.1 hypothetical protein [Deltaproteobacteria bacterium]
MKISGKQVETFIKKAFSENKGLKLLALVITLGLFIAVRAQEKVQRWVDVEVEVVYPKKGSGLVLTNKPINAVRVHIRGRRSIVNDIKNEASHLVKMDLSNRTRPGMSTFFFEPEMFNFDGVEVVDINPEAVSIRTEKLESRRLPIKIKTVGRLKEGTEFEKPPEVIPSSVIATGPASVIRSVTSLTTQEVGIDSIDLGPYSEEVPLIPIEGLEYTQDKFRVTFKVVQKRGQRMIAGLLIKNAADGEKAMQITPSEVAVSLTGPQLSLDRLDPSVISPMVTTDDVQLGKPGKHRVPIKIEGLPEDIEVKTIVPSFVELEILN